MRRETQGEILSRERDKYTCPHCNGAGHVRPIPSRQERALRGAAAGPAPPYGNDVAARSKAKTLNWGAYLFVATCPNTGLDAWDLAKAQNAQLGPGTCMVLPPGERPAKYRWPDIRLPHDGAEIVIFAFGYSEEDAGKLAVELIEASAYSMVEVLGCQGGPLRFKAAE